MDSLAPPPVKKNRREQHYNMLLSMERSFLLFVLRECLLCTRFAKYVARIISTFRTEVDLDKTLCSTLRLLLI